MELDLKELFFRVQQLAREASPNTMHLVFYREGEFGFLPVHVEDENYKEVFDQYTKDGGQPLGYIAMLMETAENGQAAFGYEPWPGVSEDLMERAKKTFSTFLMTQGITEPLDAAQC
jgi:hypothetical protein